jgi:cob(I)alamin adenosyltransferase
MGNRLSHIITRSGDQGETSLADGARRRKDDPRIVVLGELDELNAGLGLARAAIDDEDVSTCLLRLQHDLFDLGAELCQPGLSRITADYPQGLEQQAERFNRDLPPLEEFLLPGGSEALARLHLARTMARRAERALVALAARESVNPHALACLNRLSDLLFILGRHLARKQGLEETLWQPEPSRGAKD